MPCVFCIAVSALVSGAVGAGYLDRLERALRGVAIGAVRRTAASGSATAWDLDVARPGGAGPGGAGATVRVTVTVYRPWQRVRVQVHDHRLTPAAARAVLDLVVRALDGRVVARSLAATATPVRSGRDDPLGRTGDAAAVRRQRERR